jgi:hypothetical protein
VKRAAGPAPARWILTTYYAISVYFIFSAVSSIFLAVAETHQKIMGQEIGFGIGTYVTIGFAVLMALLGLGLIFRVELARGVVNFVCGFRIIMDVVCVGFTLFSAMFGGPLVIFYWAFDVACNGLMIYLIAETEQGMPNW